MKNNFTIQDVSEYLNSFNLEWTDCLIKDENKGSYRRATLKDFKKPVQLYVKKSDQNRSYLVTAEVNNETFIIKTAQITKMDASDDWKNYLSEKTNKKVLV